MVFVRIKEKRRERWMERNTQKSHFWLLFLGLSFTFPNASFRSKDEKRKENDMEKKEHI